MFRRNSVVGLAVLLLGVLLAACGSTTPTASDRVVPGVAESSPPTSNAATVASPTVDQIVQGLVDGAEGPALVVSYARELRDFLPSTRFSFDDGTPDFRFPGVAVGEVVSVEPLVAYDYAKSNAGEPVPFDSDNADQRFVVVTVAADPTLLTDGKDQVRIAVQLMGDNYEAQMKSLQNDWGVAIAALSRPFNFPGFERNTEIMRPAGFGAAFGRVLPTGEIRLDAMTEVSGDEWLGGVATLDRLAQVAGSGTREIRLKDVGTSRLGPLAEETTSAG